MSIKLGNTNIPFVFRGNEVIHPAPVKDGLVLWYDFSGRTNDDAQRDVAEDLSGNGNRGTLQNFNYTDESGYDKNGLLFDGVDDAVNINNSLSQLIKNVGGFAVSLTLKTSSDDNNQQIVRASDFTIMKHFRFYNLNIRMQSGVLANHYSNIEMPIGEIQNWVCVCFSDYFIMYLNGVEVVNSPYNNGDIPDFNYSDLNDDYLSNSGRFLGDVYSLHFYNRPLTAEEIAHNYAIEKERFGIE